MPGPGNLDRTRFDALRTTDRRATKRGDNLWYATLGTSGQGTSSGYWGTRKAARDTHSVEARPPAKAGIRDTDADTASVVGLPPDEGGLRRWHRRYPLMG